ncbi:MAG: response regulator [Clostridia bacterium]|nr:response regulator [Clostridia bacterium]
MDKYKIMIVDDEAEVREGIVAHIDWDALGFEVVAQAENGQDGLDKAENLELDVVLTDIKMPYMDGLSMSAQIMRLHPAVKLILFSGFDEFEYAKEAIRLNVVEYVLKPVNVGELTEILRRVKQTLDAQIAERRDIEVLRRAYEKSLPLMRERFLNELLWGAVRADDAAEQMRRYDVDIDQSPHKIVVIFDVAPQNEQTLPIAREFIPVSVKQLAQEHLQGICRYATIVGSATVAILTAWEEEDCVGRLMQAVNEVCACGKRIFELELSAGVSRATDALSDIHNAYLEARAALEYRKIVGSGRAIYIQDMEQAGGTQEAAELSDIPRILSVLKFGDQEQIKRMASGLLTPLSAAQPDSFEGLVLLQNAVNVILQIVNRCNLYKEPAVRSRTDALLGLSAAHPTLDTVREQITGAYLCIGEYIVEQRESASKKLVSEAESFILQNYANPHLSVDRLCEHLHVSASYFSTIFKQETGQSYVQYLTETRMQHAVQLLNTTDDKTYIIANKVGYEEPNYFSYVFKKRFGVSPGKYRG